jgi:hypothetical protein
VHARRNGLRIRQRVLPWLRVDVRFGDANVEAGFSRLPMHLGRGRLAQRGRGKRCRGCKPRRHARRSQREVRHEDMRRRRILHRGRRRRATTGRREQHDVHVQIATVRLRGDADVRVPSKRQRKPRMHVRRHAETSVRALPISVNFIRESQPNRARTHNCSIETFSLERP